MNQALKVAIIGGGPGGLTLARILKVHGMKCVKVYEQEPSRFTRVQGGCLDLHKKSGQHALEVAQLHDQFKKHCRFEGQDLLMVDETGFVHFDQVTTDGMNDRPEIDRPVLRGILLDSLEKDTVKWGHSLTKLQESPHGQIQLSFQNGETAEADFVVGADGAWSKVRPYLSPANPIYSGISFFEFYVRDVDEELSKLVRRGSLFALSQNRAIVAQRNDGGSVRIYAGLRVPEDFFATESKRVDFSNIEETKAFLRGFYPGWNEKLLRFIQVNSGEFIQRIIYALPIGHSWKRPTEGMTSKITLLGDAAHLMSPFAGEGVNMAMLDAAALGSALTAPVNEFQNALMEYEKEMFARGEAAARMSQMGLDTSYGPNGAALMAKYLGAKQY